VIKPEEFELALRGLPWLRNVPEGMKQEFQQAAFFMRIPEGKDVFIEGDHVEAIALLVSGVVRVYKSGESGREITLYRFGNGESCILTANAILSGKDFPAIATVEKNAEAFMIPADAFREWIHKWTPWREFVFELLSQRLSTVMALIDQVAFRRMDVRLAKLLLERSKKTSSIKVTHQEIAAELGSSREVISRLLEDFAEEGLILMARGEIEVVDRDRLTARLED
jgi:CRP/FNR family transcriptional regulator, anaerobic regulatory protein